MDTPATPMMTARRGCRSDIAPRGIWSITAPTTAAEVNRVIWPVAMPLSVP